MTTKEIILKVEAKFKPFIFHLSTCKCALCWETELDRLVTSSEAFGNGI